jgi:hypothetical protein
MNIPALLSALYSESERRAYFKKLEIMERGRSFLKARLYLSPDLFIQVYRNDHYNTTNFALIYNGRRIYARDQLGGLWHRHTVDAPDLHDTSHEGSRPVTLSEFLDEVEDILAAMGLP